MTAHSDFSGLSDLYENLNRAGTGSTQPDTAATATVSRRVVIVLLDVSASMAFPFPESSPKAGRLRARRPAPLRRRIDVLNEKLQEWLPLVREEGRGQLQDAEMAVLTYGGRGVQPVTGGRSRPRDGWHAEGGAFVPVSELRLGALEAFGTTPLAEAVGVALDLAEARVRHLAGQGVAARPARVLLVGDGGSYDRRLPADSWRLAATRAADLRRQGLVQVFAFGAPGADDEVMREIAGDGYAPLLESGFDALLELILRTAAAEDPFAAIRDVFGWGAGDTAAEAGE